MLFPSLISVMLLATRRSPAPRLTTYAKPAWSIAVPVGDIPQIVANGNAIFVIETIRDRTKGQVLAVEKASGNTRWSKVIDLRIEPYFWSTSYPVVYATQNGVVLISTNRVKSHLLDLAKDDGSIRFQKDIPGSTQDSCLAAGDSFAFSTDAPKPSLFAYSSRVGAIGSDLPPSVFPRQGAKAVAFGNDVFQLKAPHEVIAPKIADQEFGPADRIWALSSGQLIAVKQYVKGYWSDEANGDITLQPHVPDGFQPRSRVVSLFALGFDSSHRAEYLRTWTFQTVQGLRSNPLANILDVLEYGSQLWVRIPEGYYRITTEPRVLESHPQRLLMFATTQGSLCSVDGGPIVSQTSRVAYVTTVDSHGKSTRKTILLNRQSDPSSLITTNVGLFVLNRGHNPTPTLDYFPL